MFSEHPRKQVSVAHTCNLSLPGVRDQEDHSSRSAPAKCKTLSQKIPNTKRDWQSGSSGRAPALGMPKNSSHCAWRLPAQGRDLQHRTTLNLKWHRRGNGREGEEGRKGLLSSAHHIVEGQSKVIHNC
jgi:hypothetical protein